MIDWLTLKIDAMTLGAEVVNKLRSLSGRVMKIDASGAVEWETVARENIRSDSHQVTVCMGGELTVCGSPARVMGSHNVFGSGDPVECAEAMLGFVSCQVGVLLPCYRAWRVTRMDVTHNYDVQDEANVRQALSALRHAEGGRFQIKTAGESVYWSPASKSRSGKAYGKGEHIRFQLRKGQCEIAEDDAALTSRLLRLELSLKCEWWRLSAVKPWWQYSEQELDCIHEAFFEKLVGSVEVRDMCEVEQRVVDTAKRQGLSEGRGRAAYLYWCLIQSEGLEHCKARTARSTHYKHVKLLQASGLSYSDFQARRVVPIRRVPLVLSQPVRSFAELRRAA